MNEQSNPQAPFSTQEGADALLRNAKQAILHRYGKCQDKIRQSPTGAVVGAVAFGYLLHLLPVRAILIAKVRVILALTPPLLLLLGATKLYAFLQQQAFSKRQEDESGL